MTFQIYFHYSHLQCCHLSLLYIFYCLIIEIEAVRLNSTMSELWHLGLFLLHFLWFMSLIKTSGYMNYIMYVRYTFMVSRLFLFGLLIFNCLNINIEAVWLNLTMSELWHYEIFLLYFFGLFLSPIGNQMTFQIIFHFQWNFTLLCILTALASPLRQCDSILPCHISIKCLNDICCWFWNQMDTWILSDLLTLIVNYVEYFTLVYILQPEH